MKRTNYLNKQAPAFIVLTNDPSITAWGYAVLDVKNKVLTTGCIKTEPKHKMLRIRKGDDTVRRVSEINQHLLSVIRKYKVTYILSELPHGSQSATAAVMIGIVTGVMQTIADTLEIGVEWYSEGDSKKTVLGKRSAVKQEMISAVDDLYEVPWEGIGYRDEAVADALAIHYTASKQSNVIQLFKTMQ